MLKTNGDRRSATLEFRAIAREVAGVIRRYPVALLLPAALLGATADTLQLVNRSFLAVVAIGLGLALAFELYVAYAERVLLEAERGTPRIRVTRVVRSALPLVPALLIASALAVTLPLAATGALVIPGLWLATRWSLFAPAISKEQLGPLAAIRRSSELVQGHFRKVFLIVTLSLLIEHTVIHGTTFAAESLVDSRLAALIGAAVAVTAVSPVAALAISVVYGRLAAASTINEPSAAG
jgi:hypothetical protein